MVSGAEVGIHKHDKKKNMIMVSGALIPKT